jgi:hypothetical protein
MVLNLWRMRLGAIAASIILFVVLVALTGSLIPGSKPGIVIEFGTDPETFTGLEVEVDGKIVGKLERFGQATRKAFALSRGEHSVRVVSPHFESTAITVKTQLPGFKPMFILDVEERAGPDGRLVPVLALHQ